METVKYEIIKEFCDLDMKIDEISNHIVDMDKAGTPDEYALEKRKAMLAYSKILANIIFQSGIFDEFKHELEYSSYVNLSIVEDKTDRVESKNANKIRQDDINNEFERAIKSSMKRYFGMDVDVKINKFKI